MAVDLMGQTQEQVDYLNYLVEKGMKERYTDWKLRADLLPRIKEELRVIVKQGFASYFLMLADICQFCRDKGIPLGPARGSAGGSVVSYVLYIIDVEPMKFDLLFERFLNDERISLPDIDTDLCWARRQEVLEYVEKKYGTDYTAQIITFGTLGVKSLIDDLGRVYGISKGDLADLKKLVPDGENITLARLAKDPDFMAKLHEIDAKEPRFVPAMFKLEGLHRHGSVHAGGVVVANKPINDIAPTYVPPKATRQVIQYEMDDAAEVGLLKMDLLGLRTVTMIDWAEKDVRRHHDPNFHTRGYRLDDQAAFDIINRGDTAGIFQLEGTGMTRFAQELIVESFDDIVALLALFRPSTLDSGAAQHYIDRKNGKEPVTYPHPDLEPVLRTTYGIMLYQEQTMAVLRVMGGFSLGEADVMRRAIGSKNEELMEQELDHFRRRALERGYESAVVEEMVDLIRAFGRYGFNKSHAVAYSYLTYWCAVIKARYPAAFFTAWMNITDDGERRGWIIDHAARRKIRVLPPSVNKSGIQFTMTDTQTIMFGLGAVKGMGASFVNRVMANREAQGEFPSFWDFCTRLTGIPKDKKEALVGAGAFDFDPRGRSFLYKHARDISDEAKKPLTKAQQELLGTLETQRMNAEEVGAHDDTNFEAEIRRESMEAYYSTLIEPEELKPLEMGELEKQYINFYITADPLKIVQEEIKLMGGQVGREFTLADVRRQVLIGGRIGRVHPMKTKRGQEMCFIDLDDGERDYAVTLFPEVYKRVKPHMKQNNFSAMKVEISEYKGMPSLQAVAVFPVDIEGRDSDITIDVGQMAMDRIAMSQLYGIISTAEAGKSRIMFWAENDRYRFKLKSDLPPVAITNDMISNLKQLFGERAVTLQGKE